MSICRYRPHLRSPPCKPRDLTVLLLDCWQREYDVRPYKHFRFDRHDMEQRLNRKFISCRDFPRIVEFLQKNSSISAQITSISIQKNIEEFVAALITVQRVALRRCNIPLSFFDYLENIIEFSHIKFLSLEGSMLGSKQIEVIQRILYKSTTLKYLNLSNCNIQQRDFTLIADGILNSPSVKGFNCSHLLGGTLSIDSEKIANVVATIMSRNKLQEIVMQFCNLDAHDMELFAEYMTRNYQLRVLDVAYNTIGPDGCAHLLRALKLGSNVFYLNLRGCCLGVHGGEWIVQYLSSCYNLRYLNISYNNIPAITINTLLTSFKKRLPIKKIFIFGNNYNHETGVILHRLFEAGVLLQENIDISITQDDHNECFRIIPWDLDETRLSIF